MVRLVSGFVLAAAAAAAVLWLPLAALRVVAAGVAGLAAHEYLQITGTREAARQVAGVAAAVALCVALGFVPGPLAAWLVPVALGWVAIDVLVTGRPVAAASSDLFGAVYTGAPLGMLVAIHALYGAAATLLVVALVIVSDSMQYYSGRLLGRRALAPAISPKKTVEGAVGGLVFATIFFTVAAAWVFPGTTVVSRIVLGMVAVVLGIAGDLFESRLKRAAGVKDSSTLIPGHGGALDRIDALLFVVPAVYVYATS